MAELLGIGKAADIRARRIRPAPADIERVVGWLQECEVGWQECATEADARALAVTLTRDQLPPLNSL